MILVGLNGTTIWPISNGRIDQYFTHGQFPYQWTYRKQAWSKILKQMPKQPYLLTGFSAGGTLCHQIAHNDEFCRGIMVHSGQFQPIDKPQLRRYLPILLMYTEGDIFNTDTQTQEAYNFYTKKDYKNLTLMPLKGTTWHCHQYSNGLGTMYNWCKSMFDWTLPLKT